VNDDKIIDLESRIAYQEHTIASLNEALTDQQARISALESRVDALLERVRVLSEAAPAGGADDEPPPHY
jgi:SlyX protein